MQKQALIKQGWLRVLIFVVVLATTTLLLTLAAAAVVSALHTASPISNPDEANRRLVILSILFSLLASAGVVFLFRKFIDRQTLASLGLEFRGYRDHAATGFFLGLFLLGAGTLILIANNNLQWAGMTVDANQLFLSLVLMALVAVIEELVFRGYILNNLMESMNKWTALILSAALFALFHYNNPDISYVALVNIFLSGLLLGINYIFTKNLWFSIFLHFSWNFYQGSILGYKVSGLDLGSLLQQELSGNPWLTGGDFGLEGSVLAGLLCLVGVVFFAWIYRRKFDLRSS